MKNLRYYLDHSLSSFKKNENVNQTSVVCFVFINNEILFIRRSESMPSHKGDIAFVGGHLLEGEKPLDGALREFYEETSIATENLRYMGELDSVTTSGFKGVHVCCFELLMDKADFFKSVKSNGEWEDIFFIPHSRFLDSKNWSFSVMVKGKLTRRIYFCDIKNSKRNLWGMTASIVFKLFKNSLKGDK